MNSIIKSIESLPPLPKTIIDVMNFSKSENKTSENLILIIQKDPLLISSLLKISNSALFGFRSKVDCIENMINLLGVDFTISLILANSLENSFNIDFSPYGIDPDEFGNITHLSINFLNIWISKLDLKLKNSLLLPVILMNLGKFIISTEIIKQNKKDDFLNMLNEDILNTNLVEKEYCGFSSIEVTVLLLEHWGISRNILEEIKYIENINMAPIGLMKSAKILSIVNTICNLHSPFSDTTISSARSKVKNYDLDMDIFDASILKMNNRLSQID